MRRLCGDSRPWVQFRMSCVRSSECQSPTVLIDLHRARNARRSTLDWALTPDGAARLATSFFRPIHAVSSGARSPIGILATLPLLALARKPPLIVPVFAVSLKHRPKFVLVLIQAEPLPRPG